MYKCTACYDTGNATTFLREYGGRMVKWSCGYEMCTECQLTIPCAEYDELVKIIQELTESKYNEGREIIYIQNCGYADEDAKAYAFIAAHTLAKIARIEQRAGITLNRSFIKETADDM